MGNIGPTELLVLAVLLAVLLAVAALFLLGVIRLATRGSRGSAAPRPRLDPAELHRQATGLITAGKTIQAVKLVREQTGLGLADAKRYTDDLAAGRPPYHAFPHPGHTAAPGHTTAPQPAADLAGRARHLKATGHTEQAVLLVRGETGMNDADARRFVDSLT